MVACGLMTDDGQARMARVGTQAGGDASTDCEAAVPLVAAAGYDPGDFRVTVDDVAIDPASPDTAAASCDLGGAFPLERTGDGWRVGAPFCDD